MFSQHSAPIDDSLDILNQANTLLFETETRSRNTSLNSFPGYDSPRLSIESNRSLCFADMTSPTLMDGNPPFSPPGSTLLPPVSQNTFPTSPVLQPVPVAPTQTKEFSEEEILAQMERDLKEMQGMSELMMTNQRRLHRDQDALLSDTTMWNYNNAMDLDITRTPRGSTSHKDSNAYASSLTGSVEVGTELQSWNALLQ